MRISLLQGLALTAALVLAGPAAAQDASDVTVLFNFEGANGMGDTQGWEVTQDADTLSMENNRNLEAITQKAIGMGNFIDAFEGDYLLEATPNRPLKARTFRGAQYTWASDQDWTDSPVIKLAASMNARGPNSEFHEYRIRVTSGTGADAVTVSKVFTGTKSEEFDDIDNNTFVNEWEVLEFDLSEEAGFDLTQIRQIEATGRNVDDGTATGPDGEATPGPDGNWGGNVHVDYVTIQAAAGGTSSEAGPGLASLGDVYPNPTASGASLAVEVASAQRVTATVYDVLGRQVVRAFDGPLAPGATALLRFDTERLAPGTYVVRLQGETFAVSRRLSVAR